MCSSSRLGASHPREKRPGRPRNPNFRLLRLPGTAQNRDGTAIPQFPSGDQCLNSTHRGGTSGGHGTAAARADLHCIRKAI
jgi:hypothetical protein